MNPKDKNDKTPLERCEEHLQLVAGQDDPEFESLVNQDPEVKFWYDQLPQIIKAVEKVSEDRIREEIRAAHRAFRHLPGRTDQPHRQWRGH